MTRWLAGIFDSTNGGIDPQRLRGSLAPYDGSLLDCGPLRLAYSGPPVSGGELVCLFDGHLDNAAELREALGGTLEASGERRAARSLAGDQPGALAGATEDSQLLVEELLAAGYARWRSGLPGHLRGDFVLIVWDRARGEGLIARDQLGARPLFLHESGGTLRFAGEVRHLLALLDRRPAPDPAGVAHWIAASVRPGMQTLYEGVRRLEPGGVLLLDRGGSRRERYWTPRFAEPLADAEPELAEHVREALGLAVRRRIDADGITGLLLSGGLDSASVAAVAASAGSERLRAYSGVFPEHPAVDESALIASLTDTLALDGVTAEVHPGGLLASALESQAAWQMPLLGWGDFWTLPLMRSASAAGVRVMLGGDGGDELFGARSYLLADRMRAGRPRAALALALALPGADARSSNREVARVFGSLALLGALPYRPHNFLRAPQATREAPAWMLRDTVRELVRSDDPLAWKLLDGPRWWAHTAHGLTRGIEETGVYEHQRRRAALAGLQARHPLLDLDLVEVGLRIPPRATLDPRWNRPVLRSAMAGLLPDAVRLRPQKAWFESLIVDCLAGPDRAAVQELLTDPRAELRAYVDQAAVRRVLLDDERELRERPFRWMWQVWRLVTAECWLRAQAGRATAAPQASPARVRVPVVRG